MQGCEIPTRSHPRRPSLRWGTAAQDVGLCPEHRDTGNIHPIHSASILVFSDVEIKCLSLFFSLFIPFLLPLFPLFYVFFSSIFVSDLTFFKQTIPHVRAQATWYGTE